MNTVYAKVNIGKKLKAVLKPGTTFLVETDDIDSGSGRISFELKDGIAPSVVAAIGASSISFEAINRNAPPPVLEHLVPENLEEEQTAPVTEQHADPAPGVEESPYERSRDVVETIDLAGGAKPVASFSGKPVVKKSVPKDEKSVKPVTSVPKTQEGRKSGKQVSAQSNRQSQNSIMDTESFYRFLANVETTPDALQKSEKRMSRDEAVRAEKEGGLGAGMSMYIVNTAGAQLVIDDLGIRLLRGAGFNLGSIPPAKLKASTHLFEALTSGQIKFVQRETADKAAIAAVKHQEHITRGGDDGSIYNKADDVFDEIEGSVMNDDAAVNSVPANLRSEAALEINGDEEYETELDLISADVEAREVELEENPPPVEDIPGRRVVERTR